MCLIIDNYIGPGKEDAKIATVIVTYSLSSVVSGIAFLLMAYFRLGTLIGFFPRHILVGCIGT
jgi:SulP family sulfate permease